MCASTADALVKGNLAIQITRVMERTESIHMN